jgi:hypothetical protein
MWVGVKKVKMTEKQKREQRLRKEIQAQKLVINFLLHFNQLYSTKTKCYFVVLVIVC